MGKILLDLTARMEAAGIFVPAFVDTVKPVPGGMYMPFLGDHKIYVRGNTAFEDVEFSAGADQTLRFGNVMLSKSGSLGKVFAPPPMINWSKSKNIEVTVIDGTDAEVVERYGDGAWEIRMEGLLVDMEEHQFPLDKIQDLRLFFERPEAIEVCSQIFDSLGIFNMYFKMIDVTGVAGYGDTMKYTLDGRSIKPVEFYLNDERQ